MEKECPVCFAKFIDDSLDGRYDYCPTCEDCWDRDQREMYKRETGEEPGNEG